MIRARESAGTRNAELIAKFLRAAGLSFRDRDTDAHADQFAEFSGGREIARVRRTLHYSAAMDSPAARSETGGTDALNRWLLAHERWLRWAIFFAVPPDSALLCQKRAAIFSPASPTTWASSLPGRHLRARPLALARGRAGGIFSKRPACWSCAGLRLKNIFPATPPLLALSVALRMPSPLWPAASRWV